MVIEVELLGSVVDVNNSWSVCINSNTSARAKWIVQSETLIDLERNKIRKKIEISLESKAL